MRGTGEGFRPFDLAPKSSMTNGDIAARVDATSGPKLTVTYKGGETIVVDPKTPIVALEPGERTDLKPGGAIIARGPSRGTAPSTPPSSWSARTASSRQCNDAGSPRRRDLPESAPRASGAQLFCGATDK